MQQCSTRFPSGQLWNCSTSVDSYLSVKYIQMICFLAGAIKCGPSSYVSYLSSGVSCRISRPLVQMKNRKEPEESSRELLSIFGMGHHRKKRIFVRYCKFISWDCTPVFHRSPGGCLLSHQKDRTHGSMRVRKIRRERRVTGGNCGVPSIWVKSTNEWNVVVHRADAV